MADEAKDDFSKQIESIAKGLNANIESLSKKMEDKMVAIEEKIKPEPKEEIEDELDEFAKPEEIAKSIEKKVEDRIEQKLNDRQNYQAECNKWDQKAFKRFPALHDPNSEFSKAVEVELKGIFPIAIEGGKKVTPPDAIWNAASRVAVENPNFIQEPIHEELESGGNFKRKIKGKEMSDVQRDIADFYTRTYGLKPERVAARYKS